MFKRRGSLKSWVVAAMAATVTSLVLAACSSSVPAAEPQIIEVIKEVVVEKEVIKEVQVPGETIIKEVIKIVEVEVPGETIVIEKIVEKIVEGVSAPPVMLQSTGSTATVRTKPTYGGTFRISRDADPGAKWDSCEFKAQDVLTYSVENFLLGDYRLGPSGSGQTTFQPRLGIGTDKLAIGAMADRWDLPDPLTYRFHLRPGLRWQNKFPTNGRLVTVEELVAEFERIKDCRWPRHDFLDSVTADDTDGDGVVDSIVYNTNKPISFWGYEFAWGPYFIAAPPETIELGTDNWKNQAGTGPWMPTNYVPASLIEHEKNPDWYLTWTVEGREYSLPFMDKIVEIIIPQEATRLAALRTGRIDNLRSVRTVDRPAIEKSNPDLGKALALEDSFDYFMPMNKPPFDDIRVRIAMNMAIDREVYSNALFGGDSVLLAFPLQPEWPLHYEGIDEQPQSVQDYMTYNPAGAEALLDEAGLTRDSDGTRFEIDLLIRTTSQLELEAAEISLGFWDDIGVKVNLELVDGPVHQSRLFEKQFDFFANNVTGRPNALNDFRAGHQWNRSNLNDPTWLEMWEDVLVATDSAEQARLIKVATTGYLELAPSIQVPAGFGGDYWQPWVQNHNGERVLAFVDYVSKWAYVWLDREMRYDETGFKD